MIALALAHLAIVAGALAVAFAIALPLGIVAARGGRGSSLLLGTLGAIYTIPSLALLALLVQAFGLGVAPLFVALVAYAQFMLVRNIVAGLRGVDPNALDAGRGLGMNARELFVLVEFPLALPAIVGGIRVAAVAMVALATLGGYVGAGGLGSLIFDGLALHHNGEIVAGSIAACALAVGIDAALRGLERKLRTN
ncbi:MAG TPA: ABC transporter permease [Candidatus Baltobacteraceae bacterium]|nr:ABC transporter permease [Candidatus Baltobacteraceae bacterium]